MKNIIIAGVPRSGKTTLARRLSSDLGFSICPVDAIVSTIGKVFPEYCGISHFEKDHIKTCEAFSGFLREYLHHLEYEPIPFIVDTYHVMPESIKDLSDSYAIVFMGYPSVILQEKCEKIRIDARPEDWTQELSDDQLFELVKRFVDESKVIQKACSELDITFIDTGVEFEQSIQTALNMLSKSISDET